MPAAGALVLQAVGLASLREAERAAATLQAVQPDLEHVVIGDAATLRRATATFQRKLDIEEGLDADIVEALRRAAHIKAGCRRRNGCADELVRALRKARIAHLRRLLTEYEYVVSMDADSLACQKPDFASKGAWDVALRPVPVAVRKGPARDLPPHPPEFSGALLVLRNTSKTQNLLATWAALYASSDDGKHATSDQPLLRAALHETGARVRYLPVRYGCAVWSAAVRSCPAYTDEMRRAVAAPARAVRRDKLGGPNAALWRAHERALNREPCVLLHGLHG
jgi:hypothetical protein